MVWLKITFDPNLPGKASVGQPRRKRRKIVPGQWVVFDKDLCPPPMRSYQPEHMRFHSGDIDECYAYVKEMI